jgi:hypothetical protein
VIFLAATKLLWCEGVVGLIEFQAEVRILTLLIYQAPNPALSHVFTTKYRHLPVLNAEQTQTGRPGYLEGPLQSDIRLGADRHMRPGHGSMLQTCFFA